VVAVFEKALKTEEKNRFFVCYTAVKEAAKGEEGDKKPGVPHGRAVLVE